jgi:septum formation protein
MLQDKLKDKNLILASKSPRRQQFLKDLNLDFTIKLNEIEEVYPKELKGKQITNFLARLKASSFTNLKKNDILVTSDTIVWFKNKSLEKPKSREEAVKMLKALSDNKHKVFTSVCLKTNKKEVVFNDVTTVYIKKLTNAEINYYITNFNPFDKAGGYGIQEWFGFIAVKKIKGSFLNVMGFPVHKFYKELMRF